MSVDNSYAPKVYRDSGGNRIMIKTAGTTPGTIEGDAGEYTGLVSYQPIALDLPLGGAIGAEGKKLAPVMGNLTDGATPAAVSTKPIMAGLIGAYSLSTDHSSTYPVAAIAAQVSDGVTDDAVHGVVAYIDGDSGAVTAGAAFKVMSNNSTASSGFNFGVDLFGAAHDGYNAVSYRVADISLSGSVSASERLIIASGSAASDAAIVTQVGADATIADGSLYLSTGGTGAVYMKVSDAWVTITHA